MLELNGSVPRSLTCRLQPAVYRVIIDDVISSVQQDFEEYGLEEELLRALQQVGISVPCSPSTDMLDEEMGSQAA